MYDFFEVTSGQGRYLAKALIVKTASGICVYLGGGAAHVGTTVISQPRQSLTGDGSVSCTTSIFNILGHKDDIIAIPVAEGLCKRLKQVTVVTAGVHIEKASPEDIKELGKSGQELLQLILNHPGFDDKPSDEVIEDTQIHIG